MGRKTKLTNEIQEQICKYVRLGIPLKFAAEACGIGERTIYYWIERGKKSTRGKYLQFLQSIKKAEAESIIKDVAILEKSAHEGSWQAAAWKLERRYPEFFGKKEKMEHSGEIKTKIKFEDFKKLFEDED